MIGNSTANIGMSFFLGSPWSSSMSDPYRTCNRIEQDEDIRFKMNSDDVKTLNSHIQLKFV